MKSMVTLFFLFFCSKGISSAPAVQKVKAKDLTVTWEKGLHPLTVGFLGRGSKKIESDRRRISLSREHFPDEKIKILFIAKNPIYAPLVVLVPKNKKALSIEEKDFQKIESDVVYLWGETPKSHCTGRASYHMRFLDKKSFYKNISGLFLWKLKRSEVHKSSFFYLSASHDIDLPRKVSSPFVKPSEESHYAACKNHLGGDCKHVYKLNFEAFGKKQEIRFERSKKQTCLAV